MSRHNPRLFKINLLPRLTITFALIAGLFTIVFISVFINLEKQNFNNWLHSSMSSSLDAIDIIYESTQNESYDIEYVWGKLMTDFDQLGLLQNNLSVDELNILKENLTSNIKKTIFASFDYFIRNQRFQIQGFPFITSQNGDVLVHPTDEGKNYADNLFFQKIISSNTTSGEIEMRWPENRLGEKRKLFFKKNKNDGYYSFISLSETDYTSVLNQYNRKIIFYSLSIYLAIVTLFLFVVRPAILTLRKKTTNIKKLFTDHQMEPNKTNFNDEYKQLNDVLIDGERYLNQLTTTINKLRNQNYDEETLNDDSQKKLAKELISLTSSLEKIKAEEDKRKEELDLQNWIATGVAKFNDVLRKSSNLQEMGYDIVSSLCDYMNINQAAIYTANKNEQSNEITEIILISAYAFDRHRTINKTLAPGEGLVGAAIKETKSISLDNIPEGYIHITSGLGEAVPNHLLIIPLKREEEILGALELASFNKFKEYEVEFLEKLTETFAISISNILVSDNTNRLLHETREQAEQMAAQEEEMRQTLEELQATQEEMQRRTQQMEEMNKQHEDKTKELENKINKLQTKETELKYQLKLRDEEIKKLKEN